MENETNEGLKIDTLRSIFTLLREKYCDKNESEKIITNMYVYDVNELAISNEPKAVACAIGYRENESRTYQELVIWSRKPMGTDTTEEVNVMDPKAIVTMEYFAEKNRRAHDLVIEYKIRTATIGALNPLIVILEVIQEKLRLVME